MVDVNGWMPRFVVLARGANLDDTLIAPVSERVRRDCSPRHVLDEIWQVVRIPRTLSGKALEIPVKRILQGVDPDLAVSWESLAEPD